MILGALLLVLGGALAATLVVHLARQPWDLETRGVTTTAVASGYSPVTGDYAVIEVDGRRHTCHRGMSKSAGREPVVVLYDPRDPARCRARDSAARAGHYERACLGTGLGLALGGLALLLAWRAEPRPRWERGEPPGPLRPGLLWVARVLFVLGVVCAFASGLWLVWVSSR